MQPLGHGRCDSALPLQAEQRTPPDVVAIGDVFTIYAAAGESSGTTAGVAQITI